MKCWKKTKRGWENKKDESLIRINSEGDISSGKLANWRVERINEFEGDEKLLETTKTKIQAEKFAKSYMRKHDKCQPFSKTN